MSQVSNPCLIKKRSVIVNGHRTSVSLEEVFWDGLCKLSALRKKSVNQIVTEIDDNRGSFNLSSSIRCTVFNALSIR